MLGNTAVDFRVLGAISRASMLWMGWQWASKVVYHKQSKLFPHTCDLWPGALTLTHSVVMVSAHHHHAHTLVIDNSKVIK